MCVVLLSRAISPQMMLPLPYLPTCYCTALSCYVSRSCSVHALDAVDKWIWYSNVILLRYTRKSGLHSELKPQGKDSLHWYVCI